MRTGARCVTPTGGGWVLTTHKLRELNVTRSPTYSTHTKKRGCDCRGRGGGLTSLRPIIQSCFHLIKNPADLHQQDLLLPGERSTQILAFPFHPRWLTVSGGLASCHLFLKWARKPSVYGFLLPLKTSTKVAQDDLSFPVYFWWWWICPFSRAVDWTRSCICDVLNYSKSQSPSPFVQLVSAQSI